MRMGIWAWPTLPDVHESENFFHARFRNFWRMHDVGQESGKAERSIQTARVVFEQLAFISSFPPGVVSRNRLDRTAVGFGWYILKRRRSEHVRITGDRPLISLPPPPPPPPRDFSSFDDFREFSWRRISEGTLIERFVDDIGKTIPIRSPLEVASTTRSP